MEIDLLTFKILTFFISFMKRRSHTISNFIKFEKSDKYEKFFSWKYIWVLKTKLYVTCIAAILIYLFEIVGFMYGQQ